MATVECYGVQSFETLKSSVEIICCARSYYEKAPNLTRLDHPFHILADLGIIQFFCQKIFPFTKMSHCLSSHCMLKFPINMGKMGESDIIKHFGHEWL